MRPATRAILLAAVLHAAVFHAAVAPCAVAEDAWSREIPWRQAGLTERQAAAFLLDRFAHGARPGEVDAVVEQGLGNWFQGQLAGDLPGSRLLAKLTTLPAVALEPRELARRYSYRKRGIVRQAVAAGAISKDDYAGKHGKRRLQAAVAALERFAAEQEMRPDSDLLEQLRAQKLLRAVYSESQLVEMLTDFWFNHFNVSATSLHSKVHLLPYERDAIRPHVLGTFRELLGATARHPAMLSYLGNTRSVAEARFITTFDLEMRELDRLSPLEDPTARLRLAKLLGWRRHHQRLRAKGSLRGVNENYARELMELHTLGVDGGYSQRDVVQVARALTGWTTFPPGGYRARLEKALADTDTAADMGFVIEGEFVFRADHHHSEPKTVLGSPLPAGRGIEDGEDVLDLLAAHPSTAHHLARKLAVRFVREDPPPELVARLVRTWELTGGDLREVMSTLVESPELWREAAARAKVKTPFELAASALRALDAEISDPEQTIQWIGRMGQPLYAYGAPTGYPDRGEAWTDVGQLLARLNFGLDLARSEVGGVAFDLARLAGREDLKSLEQAVAVYHPLLMPERDAGRILELVGDAGAESPIEPPSVEPPSAGETELEAQRRSAQHASFAVALLLASPDFQRR